MRGLLFVASLTAALVALQASAARAPRPQKSSAPPSAAAPCLPGPPRSPAPAGGRFLSGGLMPDTAPGAITVSPKEAACLIAQLKDRLVKVSAMGDDKAVPGSIRVSYAGGSDPGLPAESTVELAETLAVATGGDKTRPMIVYCHHNQCQLSYNTIIRIAQLGYRRIYWMRDGIQGWIQAGYPIDWVKGAQESIRLEELRVAERARQEAARPEDVRVDEIIGRCLSERGGKNTYRGDPFEEKFIKHIEENATLSAINASYDRTVEFNVAEFSACAAKYRPAPQRNANQAMVMAQARIATAGAKLRKELVDARRSVEERPRTFFRFFDVDKLREILAFAKSPRTVRQSCGSPERTHEYIDCLDHYGKLTLPADTLQTAPKRLPGWSNYVCSRRQVEHCVPDELWLMVQQASSPQNLALIKAAQPVLEREQEVAEDIQSHLFD